jgi:hypothetical protein
VTNGAHVVSGGLALASPADPADPIDDDLAEHIVVAAVGGRGWRRARIAVCSIATAMTALALLLVLAAWRDDHIISSHLGTATAEVLSAGKLRSTISFVTPDGENRNPKLGVLYPTNLTAGQSIDVEYATNDPELVRVAGRDVRVALIPAGSVIAVSWFVAGVALLGLRRAQRRRARE